MPRRIQKQSEAFPESPHAQGKAPRLEDLPDSAYGGQQEPWDAHLDFEDMSRGHYNQLRKRHDPYLNEEAAQAQSEAYQEQLADDEDSGYNWGPPPSQQHLHDPGFREIEDDPYPFE